MDGIVKEMEDAQQRKRTLSALIEKRIQQLEYLSKMENKLHWLNVVMLKPEEFLEDLEESTYVKRYTLPDTSVHTLKNKDVVSLRIKSSASDQNYEHPNICADSCTGNILHLLVNLKKQ